MKSKQLFLAPIYGLRNSLKSNVKIDKTLLIRNASILEREDKLFASYDLKEDYKAVLEINYCFDSQDPSEPFPNLFLNTINKFDSSLVVYGDGKVGIAAVFPKDRETNFSGGGVLFSSKVQYEEQLDKQIDSKFKTFYKQFSKAYEMRPVAFDDFRRSQDRFANNDKAIDSCTVLESIFVPRGERSKCPYILNGLKIMGFDNKEVALINDLIEYRNSIIHADRERQLKLITERKYTHQKFEETFKLIRLILFRFVKAPWESA